MSWQTKKKTVLSRFLEQFADFLILILLGASLVSFLLGVVDAVVIFAIIVDQCDPGGGPGAEGGQCFRSPAEDDGSQASVLRDGKWNGFSQRASAGDVVLLSAGITSQRMFDCLRPTIYKWTNRPSPENRCLC